MKAKVSETFQKVISALPLLTASERKAVYSVLRKLDSSLEQKQVRHTTQELYRWSPLAYSVLADEIRARRGNPPKELHYLPRALISKVDDLASQLDIDLYKLVGKSIGQTDRVKWYRLYAKLVARYLSDREVPVTIKTLVQNHDKFPSLIDKAYPGYLDSGIFVSMVLRESVHP